jgi:hypothetical protein
VIHITPSSGRCKRFEVALFPIHLQNPQASAGRKCFNLHETGDHVEQALLPCLVGVVLIYMAGREASCNWDQSGHIAKGDQLIGMSTMQRGHMIITNCAAEFS